MTRGMSLHIGLNELGPGYTEYVPLGCAEKDARELAKMAKAQQFDAHKLIGKQVTGDAVTDHIEAAAAKLGAGDYFLLTYAGHGSQFDDEQGSRIRAMGGEKDGLDEAWCLWDRPMLDDELATLLGGFGRDVRVGVLVDTCHAATIDVGRVEMLVGGPPLIPPHPGLRARSVKPDVAQAAYDAFLFSRRLTATQFRRTWRPLKAKVESLVQVGSACDSFEEAYEDEAHGLYSGAILEAWDEGRFAGTYVELFAAVRGVVSKTASDRKSQQTPQHDLFGDAARVKTFTAQTPFHLA
jgi:caspase domain-containing protein